MKKRSRKQRKLLHWPEVGCPDGCALYLEGKGEPMHDPRRMASTKEAITCKVCKFKASDMVRWRAFYKRKEQRKKIKSKGQKR